MNMWQTIFNYINSLNAMNEFNSRLICNVCGIPLSKQKCVGTLLSGYQNRGDCSIGYYYNTGMKQYVKL